MSELLEGVSIDEQVVELKAAGWIPIRGYVWKAPTGGYFLGPHGAWKAMKRRGSAPQQPTEESGVLSYDDGVVSVGGLICDIEQLEASRLGASEPRPQGVSLGETREEKPDVLSYPEECK